VALLELVDRVQWAVVLPEFIGEVFNCVLVEGRVGDGMVPLVSRLEMDIVSRWNVEFFKTIYGRIKVVESSFMMEKTVSESEFGGRSYGRKSIEEN